MSFTRLLCAFAVLASASSPSAAQQPMARAETPYQPSFTVLRDDISYDLNSNGTYVYKEFESIRINSDQGVKQRSQVPLSYSASLQEVDVLEAFTITKDGRRVDVDRERIVNQQSPQSANAPMFDDIRVKTVIFPSIEIGAIVNIHWRRTQKIAQFPGEFSFIEVFPSIYDIEAAQVTLSAPASLKIYTDAFGVIGGETPSPDATRRVWHWTLPRAMARTPELGSVNAFDFSPRIVATSFPDYQSAGKAYLDRARPKAAVTPSVQKLADGIVTGIGDRRAQAEAIYQWVSNEIRYVAVFLEFGSVVPHDATEVASSRYGDCKDHVTLLEALLAARGIKSS